MLGAIIIEGHVQGLSNTRALGEQGIPVYVIDKNNCIARYSKYCKKFFFCPDFKTPEFISFLTDLAKKEKLQNWLLLPSNDHAVYNLSTNKELLSAHFKLITPEISVVEKIYNKETLIKTALKTQTPVPKSWFPENFDSNFDYSFPCLVKGKFGLNFYKKTGKKAFMANNKDELNTILAELKTQIDINELFIQELLPYKINKTVSYTAFCIDGEIKSHWTGIKLREHPINFGTATYCQSIENEHLVSYSKELLREINYTGVCEVEYLLDSRDNTFKLIEINARTWLWVGLAKQCGINYAPMIYNYVNNIENTYFFKYDIDKKWMHYLTDIPFSITGLLKGYYSFFKILSSYSKFPHPAVFRWRDILPFFAELLLIPLHLRKR
jgi:predicted ATP-grasp superfamily ATP-dependent carboligase